MENEEFYIGWQDKAPLSYAKNVRKVLMILFPAFLIIAVLIASFQMKFSTANFEFGKLTEIKGIYFNKPVPLIKVIAGKDIWGNISYISIPLIAYGKHGAATAIMEIEKERSTSLNNKEVTLKGTLLYNDGKTLLQINKDDKPLINVGNEVSTSLLPVQKDLGNQTINGEIIDPKCYFGVMKPGEGKVHRDCAIRCILGGIPPVLKVQNEKGNDNYYLLVGPGGEPVNTVVQDYVAEPVSINAHVVQQDDWIILYLEDSKRINRISRLELARPGLLAMACGNNCER